MSNILLIVSHFCSMINMQSFGVAQVEIVEILKAFDGYVALGVAVWVIQTGMAQLKETNAQHNAFVQSVLTQQQANNQTLMLIVKEFINERQD